VDVAGWHDRPIPAAIERFPRLSRRYVMIEHPTEVIRPVRQTADRPDVARAELFARLVDRPALDRAYRYATLVLGSRSDAEDATHDAALSAWRKFGDLRDPARFDAWFGRILVNTCRDQLRTRGRTPQSLDAGATTDTAFSYAPAARVTADQTDALANHEALGLALRTLSPEQREVIVLRYYFDLTVDQLAARTGARQGTVKSRLHHALRYLRSAIDPATEGSVDR
jgi:RNA polymerase sigma-70 factor (ECF subfamily)